MVKLGLFIQLLAKNWQLEERIFTFGRLSFTLNLELVKDKDTMAQCII